MYRTLRPLLFRLDPERAHSLTIHLLQLAGRLPPVRSLLRAFYRVPDHPVQAFGLTFRNRIGLAAGFDKDGLAWRGLAALGFGHIEIGTVTPRPQSGNPRPRIFRLPEDKAIINRMGFPGRGADFVARMLRGKRPAGLVLGVNIGKNKDTPNASAVEDYRLLLARFAPLADYLAVNVSSPNTVGLRRLQAREALESLLAGIAEERTRHRHVPILVKLAPDLSPVELEDAVGAILDAGMDGIIATNTTVARPNLRSALSGEEGGLSGAPLREMSTDVLRAIVADVRGRVPVIAAGGVMQVADVKEKLDAGATLVQVYTGLIYKGPGIARELSV